MPARELARWVERECGSAVAASEALGGGCINEVRRLRLVDGRSVVLKTRDAAPAGFFAAEAGGLRALGAAGARVPAVLASCEQALVLEDLGSGRPRGDYWESLAAQLASVHACTAGTFGWDTDGFIGLTTQSNRRERDGHRFFAAQRLAFQARMARERGLLERQDNAHIERLCTRLAELVPVQPAVLVHGDLWSGNIHCDGTGRAALLDPACHHGWAETDLAMSLLFGELPVAFYRAYETAAGIDRSWRERAPLYNLYHLLNHLNLFGTGYLGAVRSTLKRFL